MFVPREDEVRVAAACRSASRQRFVVRAGRRIVGIVSFPHRSEAEMV